jgi:chromosome segregation ATPase
VFNKNYSNLASLHSNLLDYKNKMEKILSDVEKTKQEMLNEIATKENYIKNTLEYMENIKKDALKISEEIKDLKEQLSKNFDKISEIKDVKTDIYKKVEEVKVTAEEIARISARIEAIYKNIEKRFEISKNIEAQIPKLMENLTNLAKEVDKSKVEILNRITREDLDTRLDGVENRIKDMINSYQSDIGKEILKLDKKISSIKPEDVSLKIQTSFGELEKKIENKINELNSLLSKRLEDIGKPEEQIKQLLEKIVLLEARTAALEKIVKQTTSITPLVLE